MLFIECDLNVYNQFKLFNIKTGLNNIFTLIININVFKTSHKIV